MTWLAGWGHRKSHVINAATGAGTNYQVMITVYKTTGTDLNGNVYVGSDCRDDFGDIRFTDDNGSTLLDCWRESYISGTSAIFWIEIADSLESAAQTIYIYYNKADATYPYLATDTAQGEATFILFDDFEDASIDGNKWTQKSGTSVEANGYLRMAGNGMRSKNAQASSCRVRCSAMHSNVDRWSIGFQKADNAQFLIYYRVYSTDFREYCYDGTEYYQNSARPTDNTLHIFELCMIASTSCKFSIDNLLVNTNTAHVPTVGMPLLFDSWISNPNLDIYWVFVSKFVATEPAHSTWGNEESLSLKAGMSIIPLEEMIFG